jgi:hypothetical protein
MGCQPRLYLTAAIGGDIYSPACWLLAAVVSLAIMLRQVVGYRYMIHRP